MIEWKEGAVCYAAGSRLYANNVDIELDGDDIINEQDFQLNEPKNGYYIPKSELDTEEKYNQAVEVFGLLGFEFNPTKKAFPCDFEAIVKNGVGVHLYVSDLGFLRLGNLYSSGVKITFNQLMTIGELKRKMNEREVVKKDANSRYANYDGFDQLSEKVVNALVNTSIFGNTSGLPNSSKPAKKRKSKEAYRILESMGIEWDNVEGKWFKVSKEWL